MKYDCKDCHSRHENCHCTCTSYIEATNKRIEERMYIKYGIRGLREPIGLHTYGKKHSPKQHSDYTTNKLYWLDNI